MALLEIKKLTKAFGGLIAVDDLDLDINQRRNLRADRAQRRRKDDGIQSGERHALLAPGEKCSYEGEDITGLNMYQIAARGLVRTFQLPTLFGSFTVLRNVLMGLHLQAEEGFWKSLFHSSKTRGS